jgi:hypothetical protein
MAPGSGGARLWQGLVATFRPVAPYEPAAEPDERPDEPGAEPDERPGCRRAPHPVLPGALWPLGVIAALLALQVVARYRWGLWVEAGDQWRHILLGWAYVAATLGACHGPRAFWRALRWRPLWLLALGFVVLNVFWVYGRSDSFGRFFPGPAAERGTLDALAPFAFFSANATFWRLVVPFGVAWLAFGLRPSALGLPWPVGRRRAPSGRTAPGLAAPHQAPGLAPWVVYLLLYLAILPVVLAVGGTEAFLAKYPMSRGMVATDGTLPLGYLLAFEALYLMIFVSGEAFWRGYLTLGLAPRLGVHGLAFMLVPYVTAHFGKPFPETLGAIGAGLLLGTLALRHRTVWPGVVLHDAVAVTMDLVAIAHHGYRIT